MSGLGHVNSEVRESESRRAVRIMALWAHRTGYGVENFASQLHGSSIRVYLRHCVATLRGGRLTEIDFHAPREHDRANASNEATWFRCVCEYILESVQGIGSGAFPDGGRLNTFDPAARPHIAAALN